MRKAAESVKDILSANTQYQVEAMHVISVINGHARYAYIKHGAHIYDPIEPYFVLIMDL